MATPNVGILTNAGKNLIDQVNAGQTKITFSKIVFSSMNNNQLTDDQIKALTTVTPQEIVVNNPKVTLDNNTGETRIRATGNNEALTDGVYVKTYAVYAKDDSGNEILYGITVSPNPNYLPEYDGVTPQAVTYSYKVNISNTSNITFTSSNDIYVSDTDLSEALQPYAKTVDVNQQLDKKVIDNHDNTITANNLTYDLSKSGLTSLQIAKSGSFNDLPLGTVFVNGPIMTDAPDKIHSFTTTTVYFSDWNGRKVQIAITDNANRMYLRTYTGVGWTSWALLSDDSTVVHSTDMRKPASDVAGIEEVNAKQDKIGYTPADDSKVLHSIVTPLNSTDMNTVRTAGFYQLISGTNGMPNVDRYAFYQVIPLSNFNGVQLAYGTNSTILGMRSWNSGNNFTSWVQFADDSTVAHLSGANNFDTVPTVNNNQLLLASSLPSDLARTGQDQEFTGKNTFDTAPIDKTTGNPYITKDGVPAVPSTLADTTKLANFQAGLQSGGVSVATSDDLKSVEDSAWHQLNKEKVNLGGTLLYKIDQSSKRIYLLYAEHIGKFIENGTTIADFSSIVKNIKTISGKIYCEYESDPSTPVSGTDYDLAFESPALIATLGRFYGVGAGAGHLGFSDGAYFTYDSLR